MSRYAEGPWALNPGTNGRRPDGRGIQGLQPFSSEDDLGVLREILRRREQDFKEYHREMLQYLDATTVEHDALREQIRKLEAQCAAIRAQGAVNPWDQLGPPSMPKSDIFNAHEGYPARTQGTSDSGRNTIERGALPKMIKPSSSFEEHIGEVHSVDIATCSDGINLTVATASWDRTVRVFELERFGATINTLRCFGPTFKSTDGSKVEIGGLYSVAFAKTSPKVLGCASADNNVYLWNWETGVHVKTLAGHTGEVNSIAFHCSQQVACSASDDKKAKIWDFCEGLTLRTLEEHDSQVYGACFLNNSEMKGGEFLVGTCSFDRKARLFDMRNKRVVATLQHHQDDILGIGYSAASSLLATGSDDGVVCLWDERASWRLKHVINTRLFKAQREDHEVKRVVFSPNGKYIAVGGSNCKVLVYDTGSSDSLPVATLDGHADCVFDVAWEQQVLVSASHDKTVRVWSVKEIEN